MLRAAGVLGWLKTLRMWQRSAGPTILRGAVRDAPATAICGQKGRLGLIKIPNPKPNLNGSDRLGF